MFLDIDFVVTCSFLIFLGNEMRKNEKRDFLGPFRARALLAKYKLVTD